jgi:hypothetical protein
VTGQIRGRVAHLRLEEHARYVVWTYDDLATEIGPVTGKEITRSDSREAPVDDQGLAVAYLRRAVAGALADRDLIRRLTRVSGPCSP